MNLAAVYSREIDGQVLTLAPSGWTYDYIFVLYDKETQTLWYPYEEGLKGIQGPYYQRWLRAIPSVDTSWRDWVKAHPGTHLMK